jgi:peptide/nickel transport system substrate-binding protein
VGILVTACLLAAVGTSACRRDEAVRPAARGDQRISIAIPSADAPLAPFLFNLTRTRLVRMDQAGLAQPGLIERWSASPDQRTWMLSLREGLGLRDGDAVTADEVVGLVTTAMQDADREPGFWQVTSVDSPGPRQVRLRLREPTSLLLESLSLVQAVPTGPYRASDEDAREPVLHAVPQAGQVPPAIGTVQVRRYETPRAAVAALLREEVDVLYEVPSDARSVLAAEDVQFFRHVKPYVVTLGLNHRHPVLARRGVRLAMNAAIDREALVAQVAGGVGVPAADIIWHQHWTRPHASDAAVLGVDKDRAGQLLDQAGLPRRTGRRGVVEPRFRLTCLVLDDPMMHRVAGRLQQAYADIGIALDIQVLRLDALLARLGSGRFEAFVSPVVSGYGLGMPYVHFGAHDHPRVIDHGYTAAAAAAERVRAATSDETMEAAVRDFHRVLIEDPPAVSLFWQETSRAVGRRVVVPADWTGDVLGSLPRWTVRNGAP